MASNDIEFDIKVNGKKAEKSIKEVDQAQEELGKTTEETSKNIKANWVAIGASIAAAAASAGLMVGSAARLDRAMFGLNKQTREYIKQMSITSGLSQEIVAGFVQTGKTAGMAGDEIAEMIDMAVALGRAYPHESTETFIDNLAMLNTMGEAQGFIVDVLEQKYGTIDLKTISLADKMKTLREVTKGVNEEFEKTAGSKVDQTIGRITTSFSDLGTSLLNLVADSGLLTLVDKAIISVNIGMKSLALVGQGVIATFKQLNGADVKEAWAGYNETLKELDSLANKFKDTSESVTTGVIEVRKSVAGATSDLDKFNKMIKELIANIRADKSITPGQMLFSEDAVNEWADRVREAIARGLSMEDAMKATGENFEALKETTSEMQRWGENTFSALENAFINFAETGKLSMKEFARSVIADLVRIRIQQSLVSAFGGTNVLGGLGGLFHAGGEVKHTGGFVGATYHSGSGLMPDERMAKLQVGEAVINRTGAKKNTEAIKAMNRGESIGGGGNVTTAEINFNVQAIDASSFNDYLVGNKNTIEGIINRSISTNGSVRKTINQAV